MLIYLVRRQFKNYGKIYLPGDVIASPGDIKYLKCKVSEGKILKLERKDPNTIKVLKHLEAKLNVPVLENVRAYLAECDVKPEPVVTVEPVVTESTVEE